MAEKRGAQRLFFAIWPDHRVRQGLLRIARSLPEHGGRELHPDDLHITLAFLGMVETDRYDCVIEAADRVSGAPFTLTLDHIDYWKRPKILWCGPRDTPSGLSQLVQNLQERLSVCGFEPEERPYAPHVTLARKARHVDAYPLEKTMEWEVGEFALVVSRGGREPPHYQVLKKWTLDS
ncbi:MAG: RNA 2',3'-cyclic phosphodiesterase [Candidatus Sedimenticola sp. PURPLELP]